MWRVSTSCCKIFNVALVFSRKIRGQWEIRLLLTVMLPMGNQIVTFDSPFVFVTHLCVHPPLSSDYVQMHDSSMIREWSITTHVASEVDVSRMCLKKGHLLFHLEDVSIPIYRWQLVLDLTATCPSSLYNYCYTLYVGSRYGWISQRHIQVIFHP